MTHSSHVKNGRSVASPNSTRMDVVVVCVLKMFCNCNATESLYGASTRRTRFAARATSSSPSPLPPLHAATERTPPTLMCTAGPPPEAKNSLWLRYNFVTAVSVSSMTESKRTAAMAGLSTVCLARKRRSKRFESSTVMSTPSTLSWISVTGVEDAEDASASGSSRPMEMRSFLAFFPVFSFRISLNTCSPTIMEMNASPRSNPAGSVNLASATPTTNFLRARTSSAVSRTMAATCGVVRPSSPGATDTRPSSVIVYPFTPNAASRSSHVPRRGRASIVLTETFAHAPGAMKIDPRTFRASTSRSILDLPLVVGVSPESDTAASVLAGLFASAAISSATNAASGSASNWTSSIETRARAWSDFVSSQTMFPKSAMRALSLAEFS